MALTTSSPVPTDLVLTKLLNDLAAAPGEVWLILDDYHLVDNIEIGHGMTFLLDHLPPHVHVMLSTRADPDLQLLDTECAASWSRSVPPTCDSRPTRPPRT